MRLTVDTSAYSSVLKGDDRLREWFSGEHDLLVPIVVIGELRAGFSWGSRRKENEKILQRFLDSPNVDIVALTYKTTLIAADIFKELKSKGTPIGQNDLWIAALTIEQNSQLITLDKDFKNIIGLKTLP